MDKPDFIDINHTSLVLNKEGNYTCPVASVTSTSNKAETLKEHKIKEKTNAYRGGWYDEEQNEIGENAKDKHFNKEKKNSYLNFIKAKNEKQIKNEDNASFSQFNKDNFPIIKNEKKFKFIKEKGEIKENNIGDYDKKTNIIVENIKEVNLFDNLFSNDSSHDNKELGNVNISENYSFVGEKDQSYIATLNQSKIKDELNSLYQNKQTNSNSNISINNPIDDFLKSVSYNNQTHIPYTVNNYNIYNNYNNQFQYQIYPHKQQNTSPINSQLAQDKNNFNAINTNSTHRYVNKKEDVLKDKFDFVSDMLKTKHK